MSIPMPIIPIIAILCKNIKSGNAKERRLPVQEMAGNRWLWAVCLYTFGYTHVITPSSEIDWLTSTGLP